MSTGFDVLIWPDRSNMDPLRTYIDLLTLIAESPKVSGRLQRLTIYLKQDPFEHGSRSKDPHIILDETFEEGTTVENVLQILGTIREENIFVRINSSYDRWKWSNEACDCKLGAAPLAVEYVSPNFQQGHRYRRTGSYRVHFYDSEEFSTGAIDFSECAAANPGRLREFAKYGENVRFVEDLFKQIASEINPDHMMVVTEGDRVNPLNFHMIYHATLSGYLFDARKILQLHQRGGGYFYEGVSLDVDPPYEALGGVGSSAYEDSIRGCDEASELADQVRYYLKVLDTETIESAPLSDEELREIVTSCEQVEVKQARRQIYLMHAAFLLGYLDTVYLRLLDRVASKTLGVH